MGFRETSHALTWDYRLWEIQIINKVIKDLPTYLRMGMKEQKSYKSDWSYEEKQSPV